MLQEVIHTLYVRRQIASIKRSRRLKTPTFELKRVGVAEAVHEIDSAAQQPRNVYCITSHKATLKNHGAHVGEAVFLRLERRQRREIYMSLATHPHPS